MSLIRTGSDPLRCGAGDLVGGLRCIRSRFVMMWCAEYGFKAPCVSTVSNL